jgi:hypothetical protein
MAGIEALNFSLNKRQRSCYEISDGRKHAGAHGFSVNLDGNGGVIQGSVRTLRCDEGT